MWREFTPDGRDLISKVGSKVYLHKGSKGVVNNLRSGANFLDLILRGDVLRFKERVLKLLGSLLNEGWDILGSCLYSEEGEHSLEYPLVDVFVTILRTYYQRINDN